MDFFENGFQNLQQLSSGFIHKIFPGNLQFISPKHPSDILRKFQKKTVQNVFNGFLLQISPGIISESFLGWPLENPSDSFRIFSRDPKVLYFFIFEIYRHSRIHLRIQKFLRRVSHKFFKLEIFFSKYSGDSFWETSSLSFSGILLKVPLGMSPGITS